MLFPIPTVRAELIINEYTTKGSGPLRVLADDGEEYIAKTTTSHVPYVEIINEVICAYWAKCWGLPVPPFALVRISQSLVDRYQRERGSLTSRYTKCTFDDQLFFGSQVVNCHFEIDDYTRGPHHPAQMKHFANPADLLKIGVFDLWIGNFDRKPDNPNILLSSRSDGRFDFSPIDHTAAFGYLDNHRTVRDDLLIREAKKSILSHQFVQAIAKFVPPEEISDLQANILEGMKVALEHTDFTFEQVPKAWGFSEKARAHLKAFLSDNVRNERIASAYLTFLK